MLRQIRALSRAQNAMPFFSRVWPASVPSIERESSTELVAPVLLAETCSVVASARRETAACRPRGSGMVTFSSFMALPQNLSGSRRGSHHRRRRTKAFVQRPLGAAALTTSDLRGLRRLQRDVQRHPAARAEPCGSVAPSEGTITAESSALPSSATSWRRLDDAPRADRAKTSSRVPRSSFLRPLPAFVGRVGRASDLEPTTHTHTARAERHRRRGWRRWPEHYPGRE
jgi:hypothetical protein